MKLHGTLQFVINVCKRHDFLPILEDKTVYEKIIAEN